LYETDTTHVFIDDDPIYQTMKNLHKSGVRISCLVYKWKDAIQALEQIITNNEKLPDLLLLDIEMPVQMDGDL
jgi:CheY-like chemotaxis protein